MKIQFTRNIISLILALVLGAAAVILLNVSMSKERNKLKAEREKQLGQQISVVVAKEDIPRGTKITSRSLQMADVREVSLQPRVITKIEEAVGKVAIADILSGEQISATKLMSGQITPLSGSSNAEPGFSPGSLAMRIPAGKRSFTISIDEVSAAGGMIKPSDYVDIMGIFPFSQQIEGKTISQNVSVTLFQNILVLATGKEVASKQGTDAPKAGGGNITFALTPQQVELLNFAQDFGKLKLILRPPLETSTIPLPPVTTDILWQQIISQAGMQLPQKEAKGEATAEKKPSQTVEIYRGKEKQVVPIE